MALVVCGLADWVGFLAIGIDDPAMDKFDADLLERFEPPAAACWVK
jgi:hypothetical protein